MSLGKGQGRPQSWLSSTHPWGSAAVQSGPHGHCLEPLLLGRARWGSHC